MWVIAAYVKYGLLPAVLLVLVYVAYERHPNNTPPTVTTAVYPTTHIETVAPADVTTVVASAPSLAFAAEPLDRVCVGSICLTDLYRLTTADACGSVPCGNGHLVVTDVCRCVCNDGWTGPSCTSYACPNNSVLTPSGCQCQWGWTQESGCTRFRCANGVETAGPALCANVTCQAPAIPTPYGCLCADAWHFGDACQFTCNSPSLNYSLCPSRAYWGWDQFVGGRGVCGLYVQEAPLGARQVQMTCLEGTSEAECQAIWEQERLHCCAPYADCQIDAQAFCQSPECCYSMPDSTTCLAAGCSWCGNACFNTTYPNCQRSATSSSLRGIWTVSWTPCNSQSYQTVACDKAVANYQAGVWKNLCAGAQDGRCDGLLEKNRQSIVVPQLVARGAIDDAIDLIRSTGQSLEICASNMDTDVQTVCWSNGKTRALLHVAPSPNTSFPLMLVLQTPDGVWCLQNPAGPFDFVSGTGFPWPGYIPATALRLSDTFVDFNRCGWFFSSESALQTANASLVVTNIQPAQPATWVTRTE